MGPHLYVVGEREEPDGPVKIGLSGGGGSRTGRGGINIGNWRELYVEHRQFMAFEDLRWTEWIIHKHLTPWRVRGEWFKVRPVAHPYGWSEFLTRSATGDIPRCEPWQLGSDDLHHLVRMRRLTKKPPLQFEATCACGVVVVGDGTLPSVQVLFALDHLHLAPTDAAVMDLTRRLPMSDSGDSERHDPNAMDRIFGEVVNKRTPKEEARAAHVREITGANEIYDG